VSTTAIDQAERRQLK